MMDDDNDDDKYDNDDDLMSYCIREEKSMVSGWSVLTKCLLLRVYTHIYIDGRWCLSSRD